MVITMPPIKVLNILGSRYINLSDYITQMEHAKASVEKCATIDPRLHEAVETYNVIIDQLHRMEASI